MILVSPISVLPCVTMDQRAASKWANICEILLLYATHVLLPTTLLLATAKRSLLRYLSVPISIFILHRAIYLASLLGPGFVWCELARLFLTVACQSANLLLINPKDAHILPSDACKSIFHRFYYSSKFFTHPRGINTPWQINNAPSQPAYYQRRNAEKSARKHFMIRQIAIVAWQYLALDMFSSLALKQALEQEKTGSLPQVVQWDLSTEQWIERIISNLVAGFVVSRVLIDFHHRVFSIIAVGTGLESISDWPPLFGRTTDAFSLRGFWS